MVEHKKERRTATNEPAQGHHNAHEAPNAPYGREAQINEEQAKHHETAEEAVDPSDDTPHPARR